MTLTEALAQGCPIKRSSWKEYVIIYDPDCPVIVEYFTGFYSDEDIPELDLRDLPVQDIMAYDWELYGN